MSTDPIQEPWAKAAQGLTQKPFISFEEACRQACLEYSDAMNAELWEKNNTLTQQNARLRDALKKISASSDSARIAYLAIEALRQPTPAKPC